MSGVGAIVLGALLVPAPGGGLRRLGQVHHRADPAQLLDQKPPPGSGLERDLQPAATEARQEPSHAGPIRRRHPRARDLASSGVHPFGGDLRSMLVKSHHGRVHACSPVSASAPAVHARAATQPPDHVASANGRYLFVRLAGRAACIRARLTYAIRRRGPATFTAAASATHRLLEPLLRKGSRDRPSFRGAKRVCAVRRPDARVASEACFSGGSCTPLPGLGLVVASFAAFRIGFPAAAASLGGAGEVAALCPGLTVMISLRSRGWRCRRRGSLGRRIGRCGRRQPCLRG